MVAADHWRKEEAELVRQARAGVRSAAEELLKEVELPVWRACRALLPPDEDVEGAVQEVLVKVLKNLGRFRGEGPLVAWACVVATHHCRDVLRRRRRFSLVPLESERDGQEQDFSALLPSPEADPERNVRARQGLARLVQAVRQLPPRQQEVFSLRFFSQLPLAQIAQSLGVDEGTVKTHLHRALTRVRQQVEEAWP